MCKRVLPQSANTVKRVSVNTPNAVSAAVKKISNIALSDEQTLLKKQIQGLINQKLGQKDERTSVFVINGDAGTGKSVILNSLFNDIQRVSRTTQDLQLSGTRNYLVVNHPEMLKLYHQISKMFPYINRSDLERPTTLINRHGSYTTGNKPVDVLIIDEAHLLATSKDAFKKFHQNNHLEELLKLAKVVVLVFDDKQSLRMGSFWSLEKTEDGASLLEYLNHTDYVCEYKMFQLTKQFRVVAKDDLLTWINKISTSKNILPLPIKDHLSNSFEFKVFESCQMMYEKIKQREAEFGQSRILATYDFPYKLDGKDYYVTSQSDEFKLRWDRYLPQINVPWSEREDTIDEVGSVYTIQGFDLNYVGVILGRSIGYDETTDSLKIYPKFYDDYAGFAKKKNINNVGKVKERIILNSLNVLLTRGVKGLYIFAWDNKLRERLLKGDERVVVRYN